MNNRGNQIQGQRSSNFPVNPPPYNSQAVQNGYSTISQNSNYQDQQYRQAQQYNHGHEDSQNQQNAHGPPSKNQNISNQNNFTGLVTNLRGTAACIGQPQEYRPVVGHKKNISHNHNNNYTHSINDNPNNNFNSQFNSNFNGKYSNNNNDNDERF